jgi:hypothetical protein
MRIGLYDAQAAMSFMVQQASYIEPQVYRVQYPEIQYPALIPTDTAGNEWAKSITFFSLDRVGYAAWFQARASDIPLADVSRTKYEQGIEMAAVGYRYDLEEIGQSMLIPGTNLTTERAEAARRAYEEFMDRVAFFGDTAKNWTGLTNDPNVTVVSAPADGTGSSALWANKTTDQITRDINLILSGVYTTSLQTETADTLLLPTDRFTAIATMRIPNTTAGLLDWIQRYNTYTAITGQPLTIRAVRGLETAGAGGLARAIAYRRDPAIVKLHLPMPHRFLPVWQTNPLVFDVPGIFRTGGVEVRRPGSMRYLDGI